MRDYQVLASFIVEHVGGVQNILNLTHCVTRLRFLLKDENLADTKLLEKQEGIISVIRQGGQYQVVIGNEVEDVYNAVLEVSQISNHNNTSSMLRTGSEDKGEKKGLGARFVSIITEVFTPLLGVLCATGLIKGFSIIFVGLGWIAQDSGTFQILQIIGDSLLVFSPVFLGYTASKKFGLNEFVGMAIGTCLIHPTLTILMNDSALYLLFHGTLFESTVNTTFLRMPVILMKYSGSIIPIIISVYVASKIEKFFNKIIPRLLKMFLVPGLTLLVIVPLTLVFIGPVGTMAAQLISDATVFLSSFNSTLTGLFIGGIFQVLVVFGIHYGLIPIRINNISVLGYDNILSTSLAVIFSTAGVLLAICLKTKNKKLKAVALPAFISAMFGVTEPALYGVTLARKKAFIFSVIGGAAGGAVMGFFESKTYVQGGLGLLAIPSYIGPNGVDRAFIGSIIGIVAGFIVGFLLTYIFGFEDKSTIFLSSPLQGKVIPLNQVKDDVFASGSIGKGVAVVPGEGKVYSPLQGEVTMLYPTMHAIGITGKDGSGILIHVGIDTVNLEGRHFKAHVKQGDKIKKNQLLLEFDINAIKEEGYDITTMVLLLQSEDQEVAEVVQKDYIDYREKLLTIERL